MNKKILGIVAVVVVLVIIVAAAAALAGNGNNNGNLNASSGVELKSVTYKTYDSGNPYVQPTDGNKFVQVSMTIVNHESSNINVNPFYFKLTTADGQIHTFSAYVNYTMPEGLAAGASTAATIGFEIANGTTPTQLDFDNLFQKATVKF